jgi:transposase
MNDDTIGIDISKDRLDAHRLATGAAAAFGNDRDGLKQLIAWLAEAPGLVVFEPTGRYHLALERALAAAGRPFAKVNPRHARRFCEALGTRAKTDRADAALLARMGAALGLAPTPAMAQNLRDLKALLGARRALIKERTALASRHHDLPVPLLRRQAAARLKRIEADLGAIDREIAGRIDADPALAARRAILVSIPGISEVTAQAMLVLMPELGRLGAPQAGCLAGLAPITRQSGRWTGRASIRGGRAELRHALYMPALTAARFNPDLRAFAERLAQAGKPFKARITAVMRKLIVMANALLRDNRKWTPNPA